MDANKTIVYIVAIIVVGICCLALSITGYCYSVRKIAFENGYEVGTLKGSNYTVWVKADCNE